MRRQRPLRLTHRPLTLLLRLRQLLELLLRRLQEGRRVAVREAGLQLDGGCQDGLGVGVGVLAGAEDIGVGEGGVLAIAD
jgi:hypothetical protein